MLGDLKKRILEFFALSESKKTKKLDVDSDQDRQDKQIEKHEIPIQKQENSSVYEQNEQSLENDINIIPSDAQLDERQDSVLYESTKDYERAIVNNTMLEQKKELVEVSYNSELMSHVDSENRVVSQEVLIENKKQELSNKLLSLLIALGFSEKEASEKIKLYHPGEESLIYTIEFLKIYKDIKNNISNPKGNRKIEFKIKMCFDKKYYVSAKIADYADDVYLSRLDGRFHVVFKIKKFSLIELLYFNEKEFIEYVLSEKDIKYIENNSILFILDKVNVRFIQEYSSKKFLLLNMNIISEVQKKVYIEFQKRCNDLYDEIEKEGRTEIIWKKEYELFICIKNLYEDAIFQYTNIDLQPQRFDIYIPSIKVAIEYQGKQHYESVEFFGGNEKLAYQKELDLRKKAIAIRKGITVLEWDYKRKINRKNFISFLLEHSDVLTKPLPNENDPKEVLQNRTIEMAPSFIERYSMPKKEERVNREVILQYDLQGNYIGKHKSCIEAAKVVGVASNSIRKAIIGERKSSGGFIWKRVQENDPIELSVPVDWNIKKTNDGKAYPIIQLSINQTVIAEFDSVSDASDKTGISVRAIKGCVNGHQKTAGGYLWKKK